MPTETRYFRNDQHTVNGLTAYQLKTTNTSGIVSVSRSKDGLIDVVYYSCKVYKRGLDGVNVLLFTTSEYGVAMDTPPIEITINLAVTQTPLASTDCIVVEVRGRFDGEPSSEVMRTFCTEQLGASQLNNATWSFKLNVRTLYDEEGGKSYMWFRHGDPTYPSRILNFSWSVIAVAPVILGDGFVWVIA